MSDLTEQRVLAGVEQWDREEAMTEYYGPEIKMNQAGIEKARIEQHLLPALDLAYSAASDLAYDREISSVVAEEWKDFYNVVKRARSELHAAAKKLVSTPTAKGRYPLRGSW